MPLAAALAAVSLTCALELRDELSPAASPVVVTAPARTVTLDSSFEGRLALGWTAKLPFVAAPFVENLEVEVRPVQPGALELVPTVTFSDFATGTRQSWAPASAGLAPPFTPAAPVAENLGDGFLGETLYNVKAPYSYVARIPADFSGTLMWFVSTPDGAHSLIDDPLAIRADPTLPGPHFYVRKLDCRVGYESR